MFHPQPTPYAHTFYSYGYDDGLNEYNPSSAASAAAAGLSCYPPGSDSTTVSAPLGLQQGDFGLGVGGGVGVARAGSGPNVSRATRPAPTPAGAWPDSTSIAGNPSAAAPGISGAPPAPARAAPSVGLQQAAALFYSQPAPSYNRNPPNTSLKAEGPQQSRSNHESKGQTRHAPAFSSSISPNRSTLAFHPHPSNMDPNAIWPTPQQTSDMEAQQAAARDYVPEFEGPPVGEKISSLSITEDYAKGNPIYVAKTTALPQTYTHYRPIRGDGNCGWRAIGFAYFESLVRSGDLNRLGLENDRIRQLNNYITQVGGYDIAIWEDMADETFETFNALSQTMGTNPDLALSILSERFSSEDSANAMLYHLRLMTASWMKGHPDDFAGFIEDGSGVDSYCRTKIEIVGEQIEHLSITALFKVLLQPAGIPMHIAYLDTSPGSHVNSHLYQVDESGQQTTPEIDARTIYLLYRPGHYDILYRPPPTEVQVNLVSGFDDRHQYSHMTSLQNFSELDMTHMAMIPGMSGPLFGMGPGPISPGAPSPMDDFVPSPQSPWVVQPSYSETDSPIQPEAYQPEEQSSSSASSSTFDTNHPLRFSRYHYQQMMEEAPAPPPSIPEDNEVEQPAFKTRLFKNSHYNTAHYNNPHFHPEEYDPAAEECPYYARSTQKRRAKIPLRVVNDAD